MKKKMARIREQITTEPISYYYDGMKRVQKLKANRILKKQTQ